MKIDFHKALDHYAKRVNAAFKFIESEHTLHTELDITYVVDGYTVQRIRDGDVPVGERFHGETLLEAIEAMMQSNEHN